jgi:hypothetical protein
LKRAASAPFRVEWIEIVESFGHNLTLDAANGEVDRDVVCEEQLQRKIEQSSEEQSSCGGDIKIKSVADKNAGRYDPRVPLKI